MDNSIYLPVCISTKRILPVALFFIALIFAVIFSLKTGKIQRRNWWLPAIDRNEKPFLFWVRIILLLIAGLFIIDKVFFK